MNVTLPNGVVIQGVPEGATKSQIMRKALAAGLATEADFGSLPSTAQQPQSGPVYSGLTAEQSQQIRQENPVRGGRGIAGQRNQRSQAAAMQRVRNENPHLADVIDDMSGPERFAVGVGEGLTDIARGVGLVDDKDSTQEYADNALRSVSSAAQVGEIVGQAAPFVVPAMGAANIASTPARIAAMGGIGGTEGGIIAKGEGGDVEDVVAGAGLGVLLGAGSEVLMPVLNRVGRGVIRRVTGRDVKNAVKPDGTPTPDLEDALKQSDTTYDDIVREAQAEAGNPADNARRQQAFEDLGLTPTEAQRTRDTDLFVEQQDAFRRGGAVRNALEQQEEQLDRQARGAVLETGGRSEAAGASPIEAITNKTLQLDEQITNLYRQAREAAPEGKNVRFTRASSVLRENAPSNEVSGGVVKALRDKMRSMGVIGDNFKPSGRVSVEQAEELRKYANRLHPSTNGEGRYILSQFKDSLDDDVMSSAGEDMFRQARKAKADFERGLDPDSKNKFDRRKVSLVRDIRDNLIQEDNFTDQVLRRSSKYKATDLKELRDYLTTGSEDQIAEGMQAWNDLRASAMDRIREKAFKGPATQTGTQSLSRAGLQSGLKEIGKQKFEVLFTPKEREFLRKLAAVSELKEPPPGTFTGSGPSSPAIQQLENTITNSLMPQFMADFTRSATQSFRHKASDRRVLNLIDEIEEMNKQAERERFRRFRKSAAGAAAGTLPAAGVAASQQDN